VCCGVSEGLWSSLTWLSGALSVATAIAAMSITGTKAFPLNLCSADDEVIEPVPCCPTGTINPPGGALALLYVVTPSLHTLGWWFVGVAVMDVLFLILVGILVNNIPRAMKYPTHWL
jgi:hypothetical protein